MLARYNRRVALAKKRLGGQCTKCGAVDRLEFDHIDRQLKSFTLTKYLAGCSKEKFEAEIVKCQLLCVPCHLAKTRVDLGQPPEPLHGTITKATHGKCKCEPCMAVKRTYYARWRAKKRGPLPQLARGVAS